MLLTTLSYAFALWFGLYLLARDPAHITLRFAGLGLLAYALGMAADALLIHAPATDTTLLRLRWALLLLPALFWFGAMLAALPTDSLRLPRGWPHSLTWSALLLFVVATTTDLFFAYTDAAVDLRGGYLVFAQIITVLNALVLVMLIRTRKRRRHITGLMAAATLFFTIGIALLIFPLDWLPRMWVLAAMGVDMLLLGAAIAMLDAFDLGEALLPDVLRSFAGAAAAATLFGGAIALVMALNGVTYPLVQALLLALGLAITLQTLADPLQNLLDRVVFARLPAVQRTRSDLRRAAAAAPKLNPALDLAALDDEEFARLTRRALSHLGDLARLAASPLVRLPEIDARLAARGADPTPLERAAELRAVLVARIDRLKPPGSAGFGTSDAWRHYNALYFPYVIGLRPYSHRADHNALDADSAAALDWFRIQVPERTLYNWQNAAARLIARDLRATQPEPERATISLP